MYILNVRIDDVDIDQATTKVEQWLSEKKQRMIFTPNPEFIVQAQKDPEFKNILNNSDLNIPDGVGLKLAGVKNRIAGIDFMESLVAQSAEKGFVVGFLGGRGGVAELTSERLVKKYPKLKVGFVGEEWRLDMTHDSKIDILFVAFGAKKQAEWISENLAQIPVKVAIGVGGSFDYISGKVTRAPKWMRDLGLEWLFRLIRQPWRFKRQLALIEYILLLNNKKIIGKG